jgi:Domain of unknown function (DUF4280)
MPVQVVSTASLACTFGAAPSTLTVLPVTGVSAGKMPAATIMDFAPMVNIGTFGMCLSIANPTVAAATAAALGVFTPMPCIPATTSPWTPGAVTVSYGGMPALDNSSMCMCMWAGVISVVSPGQMQTTVP